MSTGNTNSADDPGQGISATTGIAAAAEPMSHVSPVDGKHVQQVELRSAGSLFSPQESFVWVVGLLGVGACLMPWVPQGWLWFGIVAASAALLACCDGLFLWLGKEECLPLLLRHEKGLRGLEGKTIQIPFALTSSRQEQPRNTVLTAVMPATRESEAAFRVEGERQWLKLEQRERATEESTHASVGQRRLWPWTAEITLLRRGLWPGPRVGIERQSRFRIWRLRRWFDMPEPLRIDANLRSGRQEILRSPVYRMLLASQQTPWTGQGREFERLREYQPGDTYSEIAWKSTARRCAPVTRLFQWEQKQEVYFVVDQSRASALALHPAAGPGTGGLQDGSSQRMLDLAVKTALVGATVALELGDEFGLVTFADGAKSWLRSGSGRFQFHRFRDCLLNIEPLPTNADYEALFSDIQVRLRRRAYLVLLADLTERSIADSLRRGINLARSSHALLMTSILPAHARPAFSSRDENLSTDQDVYGALASDKENQRLGALARQLRQLNVQLRYIPAEKFLRTAIEGYLESKREQRL